MGLFDLFRSSKTPKREDQPEVRSAAVIAYFEIIQNEVQNLRLVGRKEDAEKVVRAYLDRVLQEWTNQPGNPSLLCWIAQASISSDCLEVGRAMLESVLAQDRVNSLLDVTMVYVGLGKIYHRLGYRDPEANSPRELWCYDKATEAKAPPDCKHVATQAQKAAAHSFAYMCAKRIRNHEAAELHDRKRRGLAPALDWDNVQEVLRFMESAR